MSNGAEEPRGDIVTPSTNEGQQQWILHSLSTLQRQMEGLEAKLDSKIDRVEVRVRKTENKVLFAAAIVSALVIIFGLLEFFLSNFGKITIATS